MKRYIYSVGMPSKNSIDRAYKALKYAGTVVGVLTSENVANIIVSKPDNVNINQLGKYVKEELIYQLQDNLDDIVDEASFYVSHRVASPSKVQEVLDLIPDIVDGLTARNMDGYVSVSQIKSEYEKYLNNLNSSVAPEVCFADLVDHISVYNAIIGMRDDEMARYPERERFTYSAR